MSKLNRLLLAGAALFGAFCGVASADPITLNDTAFVPAKDAKIFQTIGGGADLYQTLNFASAPTNGVADTGEGVAFVNVTSFLDPSSKKIAANLAQWSVYAEIDYSVAGTWTGITSKGAGDYTSTAVTGTLALYAVSGNCKFAFTPPTAGPSTVIGPTGCDGTAVEIAAGTVDSDSLFALDAGKVNESGGETGSESFFIDTTLSSVAPSILTPTGAVIDLTIDSGTGVGSNTTDRLVDAPAQYWCTNGGSGNCGSDNASWSADPPAPVPEPASLALFGAGLLGFSSLRRRNRS